MNNFSVVHPENLFVEHVNLLNNEFVKSFQNFMNDPKLWWERMLNPDRVNVESPERTKFTKALAEAKPNPGHFALVELEVSLN